jgi:hypothetical protein
MILFIIIKLLRRIGVELGLKSSFENVFVIYFNIPIFESVITIEFGVEMVDPGLNILLLDREVELMRVC